MTDSKFYGLLSSLATKVSCVFRGKNTDVQSALDEIDDILKGYEYHVGDRIYTKKDGVMLNNINMLNTYNLASGARLRMLLRPVKALGSDITGVRIVGTVSYGIYDPNGTMPRFWFNPSVSPWNTSISAAGIGFSTNDARYLDSMRPTNQSTGLSVLNGDQSGEYETNDCYIEFI